jgi:hypothetical protein
VRVDTFGTAGVIQARDGTPRLRVELAFYPKPFLCRARGNAPWGDRLASELSRDVGSAREQRHCVRVAIKEKPQFTRPRLLRFCATLPVANCHGNAPVMPKPGVILILRGARPSFAGLTRLSFMRWSAGRRAYLSQKARRLLAATSNLFATREKCCHDMLRRNIIVRRGRSVRDIAKLEQLYAQALSGRRVDFRSLCRSDPGQRAG